jgi:hypothetical protein
MKLSWSGVPVVREPRIGVAPSSINASSWSYDVNIGLAWAFAAYHYERRRGVVAPAVMSNHQDTRFAIQTWMIQ